MFIGVLAVLAEAGRAGVDPGTDTGWNEGREKAGSVSGPSAKGNCRMLTDEEIVTRIERAFAPLRCVAQIYDYRARLRFKVFDENGNGVIERPEILLGTIRDETQLEDLLADVRARISAGIPLDHLSADGRACFGMLRGWPNSSENWSSKAQAAGMGRAPPALSGSACPAGLTGGHGAIAIGRFVTSLP